MTTIHIIYFWTFFFFKAFPSAPSNNNLLDPQYSPCSCDLTVGKCDFECCCDPDCTLNDKQTFRILCKNRIRTIYEKTIDEWTCNNIYNEPRLMENDWFPIICIQFNTSVLLGKFYSPKTLTQFINQNSEQFTNKINSLVEESYNIRSKYSSKINLEKFFFFL